MEPVSEAADFAIECLLALHGFNVCGIRATDGAILLHDTKNGRYVQVYRDGDFVYLDSPNFADFNATKPETDR